MSRTTRRRSDLGPLAAIVAGDGPLVLLLHGVGLRAEAWGAQIDALAAAGFRVVAPDLPGHGASVALRARTLAGFSAPHVALLSGPALVAGHSMGAMLALGLASGHPDRIRGVAALNAIYRRDAAARAAVRARAEALDGVSPIDPGGTLERWFGESASAEREACEDWLRSVDPAAYKAAYAVFAEADGPSDEALRRLDCPALFMTGSAEPNSTAAMSRAMAAVAPRGRARIVPGAAHMMPMTHAAEVNDALLALARECLE